MIYPLNKFIRNTSAVALLASVIVSCTGNKSDEGISFIEIKNEQTAHLIENDKQSPECHVKIELTFLKASSENNTIVSSINDSILSKAFNYTGLKPEAAVDSFSTHYIHSYRTDLMDLYNNDESKHEVGPWFSYNYELGNSYEIINDSILNYTMNLEVFEGGAHGSHVTTYMNFNLNNGKPYTLNDILIPGYESPITALLLKKLMEQHKVTSEKELNDIGYLTFGTPLYIPENYLIHPDKIEFFYNQYEIAPYALGTTTLVLNNSEINSYLKNKK